MHVYTFLSRLVLLQYDGYMSHADSSEMSEYCTIIWYIETNDGELR